MTRAVAAVAEQPPVLGQHDRAVVRQLLRGLVGVVVAGHEHELRAEVGDLVRQARLERAPAVAQVAGEEHRPVACCAFQDRQRDHVVVEVGRERDPRAALDRRPPGRIRHQPREADELRVELLVEGVAGPPDRCHRVQRARDVGAVGVVLRGVHGAAWRQQDHERHPERDRRRDRGADRDLQARPGAAPDRERDEDPQPERAQGHHEDQRAQVAGDRVSRLASDRLQIDAAAVRHPLERGAVDGPEVHAQPRRRADRLEPRAPVDERDVDVERPGVPGGDRQPDPADRQLAVLPVRDEREIAAEQRGDDDREHGPDPRAVAQDVPPLRLGRRLWLAQRARHRSMMARRCLAAG